MKTTRVRYVIGHEVVLTAPVVTRHTMVISEPSVLPFRDDENIEQQKVVKVTRAKRKIGRDLEMQEINRRLRGVRWREKFKSGTSSQRSPTA